MTHTLEPGQSTEATDPRILRSRRMLMDSLASLLSRKDFSEISVQDIAEEATLNRATFYLHYTDKHALLRAMTGTRFRELIARRGLSFTDCDGALGAIALGVCDYLAETAGCPGNLAKLPLETSVIPVVEEILREGASRHPARPGVDADLLCTAAAWAIFGAAQRWYQTPDPVPAEEIACRIEALVKPILLSASGVPGQPSDGPSGRPSGRP